MKSFSSVCMALVVGAALASPALAGTAGVSGTHYAPAQDRATIAYLQRAADKALQDGRDGNKNNVAFRQKNYEIERLVAKMKAGEPLQQTEIEQALQPVHVW
jgi:hypothetical protein